MKRAADLNRSSFLMRKKEPVIFTTGSEMVLSP